MKANEELLGKVEQRLERIYEDISAVDDKISELQERRRKLFADKENYENKRILMIVNLNNVSGTELKEILSPKFQPAAKAVPPETIKNERNNENEDDE